MKVNIYCGWEFSSICVDCEDHINDLTLVEAKELLLSLEKAIAGYEYLEKSCQEYFKEENSNVEVSDDF